MFFVNVQCNYLVAVEGSLIMYPWIVKDHRYKPLSPRCSQQNEQLFFLSPSRNRFVHLFGIFIFHSSTHGYCGPLEWGGRRGPKDFRLHFLF